MPQNKITVETIIEASINKVWDFWTNPMHIIHWNHASDDWHSPSVVNDLRPGGKFSYRMEAKDGSSGFDFEGVYSEVKEHELISYSMTDDRKVDIHFIQNGNSIIVSETFDPESVNSLELQKSGWQSILDNFKKYVLELREFGKLHFEIRIEADVEKVYSTMLDKKHFAEWTKVFNPTSYYEGSWKKGSKILFLCRNNEGKTDGMVGSIQENIPNKYVSIKYIGFVKNGEEITSGPEIKGWADSSESYSFNFSDGVTTVCVDMETNKAYVNYFNETYPKALNILKELCEEHV